MATPLFTRNRAAQQALANGYGRRRYAVSPFVTDTQMSRAEAHRQAFAELRARMGNQPRQPPQRGLFL